MNEFDNNNIGGIVNSEPNIPNKKGNNVVLIIVLIIIAVGMGIGGFVLGTKLDNEKGDTKVETSGTNDATEDEKSEQNNVSKPEKNSIYTFLEEQNTEIEYSGSTHEVVIYYYLDKEEDYNAYDELVTLYCIRRDLFIDGNKIIDAENYMVDINVLSKDDIPKIGSFKYRLIKDLNGKDEYAIIDGRNESINIDLVRGGISKYSHVIDKNAKSLLKIETQIAYSDVNGIMITEDNLSDRDYIKEESGYRLYYDGLMDLHTTYIYYIEPCKEDSDYWQEYKVTISDGNVKKDSSTRYSYDIVQCAGQC